MVFTPGLTLLCVVVIHLIIIFCVFFSVIWSSLILLDVWSPNVFPGVCERCAEVSAHRDQERHEEGHIFARMWGISILHDLWLVNTQDLWPILSFYYINIYIYIYINLEKILLNGFLNISSFRTNSLTPKMPANVYYSLWLFAMYLLKLVWLSFPISWKSLSGPQCEPKSSECTWNKKGVCLSTG